MQGSPIIADLKLSPRCVDLLRMVADDVLETAPLLYQVANMPRAEEVLAWLIKERLTGKRFVQWVKFQHKRSLLSAMSFALKQVNRDLYLKPLFAGKDLR